MLASDGHNYHISVTCGDDAGVPADAELSVEEILDDTPEYQDYAAKAENAMGWEEGSASYLRLFDIKIVDAEGEKVEITAPVDVVIELADIDSSKDTVVLHFADDAEEPDVVQNVDMTGETLSFEADGFSAYAIVSGPEEVPSGWLTVGSLDELLSLGGAGLYIGHPEGYYLKGTYSTVSGSRTGIDKTKPAQNYPANAAVLYYFEPAGTQNTYYIYCLDGSTRKYIRNANNNSLSLTTNENQKTPFLAEEVSSGVYRLHAGNWYINMRGGATGDHFAA